MAVPLLTYLVANKIRSCEICTWHIIHILGFITPDILPICLMIMAALAIFQALIYLGVGVASS